MLKWTREFMLTLEAALDGSNLALERMRALALELFELRFSDAMRYRNAMDAWPVVASHIPLQLMVRYDRVPPLDTMTVRICGAFPRHRRNAITLITVSAQPQAGQTLRELSVSTPTITEIRDSVRGAVEAAYLLPRY